MAIVDRRSWLDLKSEHILRVGRGNDATYAASGGRAEQFLTAAYFHICKTWHHLELDSEVATLPLNTTDNTVNISTEISPGIVFAVQLREVGGDFLKMLVRKHARAILNEYNGTAGQPSYYMQYGEKLYVDTLPDVVYQTTIFYYDIEPEAPEFAAVESALGRAWDELILEYSVQLAQKAIGRFDIAMQILGSFNTAASLMPQPLLAEDLGIPMPETRQANRSHAGGSG